MSLLPASPPAPRRRRFVRPALIFAVLGPGLIAANAGNDAGGIVTYASAGSAVPATRCSSSCVLVTVALVVGAGDGGAARGVHRRGADVARARAVLAAHRARSRSCASSSRTSGSSSRSSRASARRWRSSACRATSRCRSARPSSSASSCSAPTSGPSGSSSLLSLVFLAYPVAMVLAEPDWGEVAKNTSDPALRRHPGLPPHRGRARRHDHHALHAAVPGGRGRRPRHRTRRVPARAHRHGRRLAVRGAHLRCRSSSPPAPRLRRASRSTSASQAAKALEPVAGASAEALFAIGLLGASMLAAAIVPLSTAYGRRRGGGRGALGVASVPRGAAVPRAVHRADRDRRRASR